MDDGSLSEVDKVDALHNVGDEAAEAAMAGADSEVWYPELEEDNILGVPYAGISDDEVDDLLAEIERERR